MTPATRAVLSSKGRREAFGFFVGGTDLAGDGQGYTYFLIRDGGQFLVKQRMGAETATVQNWTSHNAISSWSGEEDSTAKNVLALSVEGDRLSFSVNGQEVWSGAKGDLALDGVFGFRVNHGLNVHITSITTGG